MTVSRRTFLGSAGAAGAISALASPLVAAPQSRQASLVKPRRLQPGQTVGLVDPASATWYPVDIEIVSESMQALGLKVKVGAHVLDRRGYFAGTDEARAADLNAMFRDPEVDAILAVRGGWGSARVLPLLDFEAIRKSPKILMGYSDITALLLAIYARTNLVTFHGPVGASPWNAFNVAGFKRVLFDAEPALLENLKEKEDTLTIVENRVMTITPGVARGRLLGGNLTIVTSLLGSSYLPDWRDAVLFLEDVEEAPYRVDRMLTQLKLAGVLDVVRAVVFGRCTRCSPGEGFGSLTLPDILNDHLKPLKVPAWHGAMIGHIERQFTLPVGLPVEVDATLGTIRLLEPPVA